MHTLATYPEMNNPIKMEVSTSSCYLPRDWTCLNMSENVLVGCSLPTQEPACEGAQWFRNGVLTKLNIQ